MYKRDLITLSYQNLWRRKARTILTVLGVTIGTTSIVVMLSLGIGIKESQQKNMEQWGDLNIVRVMPGMNYDKEGRPLGEAKRLDKEAVAEIKGIEGVIAVCPAYEAGVEAKYGNKRGHIQLIGMDSKDLVNLDLEVSQGRLLEPDDRGAMVVGSQVINTFVDEKMLRQMRREMMVYHREREKNDPTEMINKRITMLIPNPNDYEQKKLFHFQVVGLLEGEYKEHAHQAYVPIQDLEKMRKYMFGNVKSSPVKGGSSRVTGKSNPREYNPNDYSFIIVRTDDVAWTKKVSQTLKDQGYYCYSIADQLEGIEKSFRIMQAILGGIGGITLLVAALGITNTMIMSIYERTKEIGIMKVIGANFRDIHAMFITEAGLIGVIGGTIGLGFSYVISYILNQLSRNYMNRGMPVTSEEVMGISLIPPYLAIFALVFAFLIGVLAGLYPANRAVRLSPIQAIRNE